MKAVFLMCCLFMVSDIYAQELKCELRLRPIGIYYNYCPVGTLIEAVDVRVHTTPYSVIVNTLVRCVEPVIECK